MKATVTVGILLTAVSIVPTVQTVRAIRFWEKGRERYAERPLQELPLVFAGREVNIRDMLPEWHSPSETRIPADVAVLLDDSIVFTQRLAEVRPGRSATDLGRYHLWIDAWVFADRQSGDSVLMLGQRVGRPDQSPTGYAILTIRSDGSSTVRRVSFRERAVSFPTYRTIQFLNDAAPSIYAFDLTGVWPNLLIPILYPAMTGLIGLVLLMIAGARWFLLRRTGRAAA